MSVLAHHAALAVSVAAIAGASVRVASAWLPGGPERVLAAAAAGCTAIVLETLLLGLVGLGGSPIALGAAALATWALVRSLLPAPEPRVSAELAAWWAARGPRERIAWGALAGAFAWWVAWAVIWPPIGFDAGLYQDVEIANWVQGGDAGSVQVVNYEFPVGNYPLGNEVLLAWGAGLAHGWVPLSLLPVATWVLTGLATWTGLRGLAGTRVAALGTAALLTVPALLGEVAEPDTDLPAVCWLVVAGALTLAARERPKALAPLLLACGLAIGTKTTVVPLIAVLLVVAWLRAGRPLPVRALAVAGSAAAVVGGVWYVRNLVTHGSPFWPFMPGPFGDPTPRWLSIIDNSFLERPRATLDTVPGALVREGPRRVAAAARRGVRGAAGGAAAGRVDRGDRHRRRPAALDERPGHRRPRRVRGLAAGGLARVGDALPAAGRRGRAGDARAGGGRRGGAGGGDRARAGDADERGDPDRPRLPAAAAAPGRGGGADRGGAGARRHALHMAAPGAPR